MKQRDFGLICTYILDTIILKQGDKSSTIVYRAHVHRDGINHPVQFNNNNFDDDG